MTVIEAADWRDAKACGLAFLDLDRDSQRATCFGCPVRVSCRDFALACEADVPLAYQIQLPVYGGLSGRDRARLMGRLK